MILPFVQVGSTIHMMGRKFPNKLAAEKAEAKFISRAEKSAGRRLSMRELVNGVQHPENRDRHQQMVDEILANQLGKPLTDAKPAIHPMDDPKNKTTGDHRLGTRETREALHAKAKAAYDKRTQKPDPAAEKRREKAIAHAHDVWASVAFDSSVPMSIIEAARRGIRIAENRTDEYASSSSELITRIAKHKQQRATAIELQAATARAGQVSQFEQPSEFEPAPEPAKRVEPYPNWHEEQDDAKRAMQYAANREALGLDE